MIFILDKPIHCTVVKIYDNETAYDIALKIYRHLETNCSVLVFGFETIVSEQKVVPRGELVIKELEKLYDLEFIYSMNGKRMRRFKYRPQSIGGPVLHPIFTWEKRIVDTNVRYTIWKVQ